MRIFNLFIVIFFIASCGGGGGGGSPAVPFAITLASNIFSLEEDTTFNGSISATANEVVTLSYSITSTTTNGSLNLSGSGSITYIPNKDFNGQDQFTYSVTATEKNVTETSTVSITVNPVNDAPTISIVTNQDYDDGNLLFDQNPIFSITFNDIDNEVSELLFSSKAYASL